ncbi:hypothetical protein M3Y97_00197800 [Aphelenchoides bicaudatus]|nr:hypothetical protein M3Y97_00197800 [Aphelenchoides bicaudatus]
MATDDNIMQMARLEFRSSHDVKQATKNVRKAFGFNSIDLVTMRDLYNHFEKENIKPFNEVGYETEMSELFPNRVKDEFVEGMISQLEGDCLFKKVITIDGRIGFNAEKASTSVINLFTGESTMFPNSDHQSWPSLTVVDKEYLIAYRHLLKPQLALLKYDLKAMTLKQVHSVEIGTELRHGKIVFDQSVKHRFVVYNRRGFYIIGKVESDRMFISSLITSEPTKLCYPLLYDDKLCGIRYVGLCWYFLQFDLRNLDRVSFSSVPYSFKGKKVLSSTMRQYTWSGARLYVGFTDDESFEIFVLDTATFEWEDTGIKLSNHVQSISVNKDEVLTVVSIGRSGKLIFHRFPLKKPDSLMNIAWFACMRRYGKEQCKKLLNLLPPDCHLRL